MNKLQTATNAAIALGTQFTNWAILRAAPLILETATKPIVETIKLAARMQKTTIRV